MSSNYKGNITSVLIILKKDHNIFYPNNAQYNARITTQITNILKLFFSLETNVKYIDKKYCINIARSISENSNIFLTNKVDIDVASGLITSDLEEYEKESLNDKSELLDNVQEEEKIIYKTDHLTSFERSRKKDESSSWIFFANEIKNEIKNLETRMENYKNNLLIITKLHFKAFSIAISPFTEHYDTNM